MATAKRTMRERLRPLEEYLYGKGEAMSDQNLVGVGDEVQLTVRPGAESVIQAFYKVVASQPEDEGHIIVRGWYGDSYYNAWHPSRLRTPDGKPVTGFRQVRAEVIERESAYLYVGSELVWSFRYAKDAKSAADAINKALGVE